MSVRPKKHLGQHFLTDKNTCERIAAQYGSFNECQKVLEIGPGTGALTTFLLKRDLDVWVMEVDVESIRFLKEHYPELKGRILNEDFLKTDLSQFFGSEMFGVVGNFPYNISSQILFKCLEYRNQIPEIMGMFQKEVAERIAEKPGSKKYGILSVLLQTYYDISYCFTVGSGVFNPPPKVDSGVIRCTRNQRDQMPCNEKLYTQVIKSAFNQRRKTMRNSLKALMQGTQLEHEFMSRRPETMSVEEFIELTCLIENNLDKLD